MLWAFSIFEQWEFNNPITFKKAFCVEDMSNTWILPHYFSTVSLLTVYLLAHIHLISAEMVVSGLGGCFGVGVKTFLKQPGQLDGTEIEINTDHQCEWEKENYKEDQTTELIADLLRADKRPLQVISVTAGNVNKANLYDRARQSFLSRLKISS